MCTLYGQVCVHYTDKYVYIIRTSMCPLYGHVHYMGRCVCIILTGIYVHYIDRYTCALY